MIAATAAIGGLQQLACDWATIKHESTATAVRRRAAFQVYVPVL